ncbi:MAG: hypothetical protein ACP5PM_07175 [Acidimicrobiales bacterium]|nr:hypothetical protein [Actinomycetota bacterium]
MDIVVSSQGEGRFLVEVRGPGATSAHTVDVPAGLAEALGWGDGEEADLVRASFLFLLDREPPSSILSTFSLEVIARYFPDYPDSIRRRVT